MNKGVIKNQKRNRRRIKIRAKVDGDMSRPRLSIYKSNKEVYLQIIDDKSGKTIVSARSQELKIEKKDLKEEGLKTKKSFELGKLIAEKAKEKKIKTVVFDRGGFKYHGRIKAAADGAREGGLEF